MAKARTILLKRSVSRDGRIEALSVEAVLDIEEGDTPVLEEIKAVNSVIESALKLYLDSAPTWFPAGLPPGGLIPVSPPTETRAVEAASYTGTVLAVYPKEPSKKNPSKLGPGAVILDVDGQRVRLTTFDTKALDFATENHGKTVTVDFKRNEKFGSLDIQAIRV